MRDGTKDWLEVVYGPGLDVARSSDSGARTAITVRQNPELGTVEPGREHRVRVTVAPSEPGLSWRLYLRNYAPDPGEASGNRVWWRLEPGTWQPLGGTRQCVAEGRGRVRVDVSVRVDGGHDAGHRLRFVAESASGG